MLKFPWYTFDNGYAGKNRDFGMKKPGRSLNDGKLVRRAFLVLVGFGLLIAYLLSNADIRVLNPKGLISSQEHRMFLLITAILLAIAIPTLFLFYFYAWKYRETNSRAAYKPNTRHGKGFMFISWAVPSVFMLVLIPIMWSTTHHLEPQKAIAANVKPLTIQVIALRWKWVFLYPEQQIATVNFVQIPTGTPVQFELTADETPMSSFWIPHLGGQLYAMTGHINRLNLLADTAGDYPGSTAEINGAGFAGMKFTARASTKQDFDSWVQKTQLSSDVLDSAGYEKLVLPSENNEVMTYNLADEKLYDKVVMKYMGSNTHHTETTSQESE